jgi:hypothetical protein
MDGLKATACRLFYLGKCATPPASKGAPNQKHDDSANGRSNETGTFTCLVPAERLAQERGEECSDDAENCSQNEATGFITGVISFASTPAMKPISTVHMIRHAGFH